MHIQTADTSQKRQRCYALRHKVFVEEQGVPVALEIDEHDETNAHHIMVLDGDSVIGTARLCQFGDVAKIQRVAVAKSARGQGLGRQLVKSLIETARQRAVGKFIALDAQTHATRFYQSMGFEITGEPFDDAGIEHIHMRQPL